MKTLRLRVAVRIATLALLLPAAASAQFIDFTPQADMANHILMDQAINRSASRSRELIFGVQGQGKPDTARPAVAKPVMVRRVAPGSGIAALVAAYPPPQRAGAEAAYRQMWAKYPEVVAKLDPNLSKDDLSGSAAVFLLGCFRAYDGHDVPDGTFPAVIRQVRTSVATGLKAGHVQAAELSQLHEQLAVIGMSMALMQEHLAAHPDAEMSRKTREAAARYLTAFLGVEAARLRFSEQGMRVAE